jgi:hypothetical protein
MRNSIGGDPEEKTNVLDSSLNFRVPRIISCMRNSMGGDPEEKSSINTERMVVLQKA